MDVFGSSGVRGVVNEGMTPDFVMQIAQAAGTVWDTSRVAIAHDTRTSGSMLTDAAASGLASIGIDVDRLGTVPTPAAQQYAEDQGIPVVIVTASHNPPQFNGIKLIGSDGIGLPINQLEQIEQVLIEEAFDTVSWKHIGQCRTVNSITDKYIHAVCNSVNAERIAAADLTVALDPGHGAGCLTSPNLLRALDCNIITVNAHPDGRSPGREPEPVPAHLSDLCRLVKQTDADIGIAHDGDADRAVFVDETGSPIDGSTSLAALAAAELSSDDTIVSAVNVSQRVVDAVSDVGASLELTPIGATHLVQRIRELRSSGVSVPIAGEGNGGVMYPPYRTARDGAYTAARFLELITETPASEIAERYSGYATVRRNLTYSDDSDREQMLQRAKEWARAQDGDLDMKDGHRVDFGDSWVLVRPSGTEPLIRAYAEAQTEQRANQLLDSVTAVMQADA